MSSLPSRFGLFSALAALLVFLSPAAFAGKSKGPENEAIAKAKPATKGKAAPKTKTRSAKKPAEAPSTRTAKGKKASSSAAANRPKSGKDSKSAPKADRSPAKAAKSAFGKKARLEEPEVAPAPARSRSGSRLLIPPRQVAEQARAFQYANLSDLEALAALAERGIPWVPATPPLPGVRTPIRLTGPLHGVTIHSTLPEKERGESPFEILDARLALALHDFCALLARHDVVEIVHYTMYRPPAELPPDLNRQIRHPAGLAIDVGALRKRDGRWLAVGPHWPSDIGAKTCGEGAREHWARAGRELVSIACEAADERMFHFILTPHFDAAHADHLHLEVKPETRWFLFN